MFLSEEKRLQIFLRRENLSFYYKVMLAFAMAGLTGVAARAYIYLPFTPVPVTLQVLPVLLSGVFLGSAYGLLSMAIYIALGVLGVPWFAGGKHGINVLFGATGGYLLGFMVAAYTIGYLTDRYREARKPLAQGVLMLAGVLTIYTLGVLQLSAVTGMSMRMAVLKGVLPFIPGDILKAVVAMGITSVLLPQGSYTAEKTNFKPVLLTISTLGAAITVVLFWINLLNLSDTAQLLRTTAIYTLPVLFFGAGMLRALRG